MELKELQDALSELKSQGMSEEDILGSLYTMFIEDKIDANQLEAIADEMGYQLSEEFKKLPDEEKKTFGLAEEEAEEEDPNLKDNGTRYEDDDESGEEEEDESDESGEDEGDEEDESEEEEDEDESEDDESEEDKAMKLFGLNKNKKQ